MCCIHSVTLTLDTTDDMFLQTVLTHWKWALCIDHWHNRACLIRQQWRTEIKQLAIGHSSLICPSVYSGRPLAFNTMMLLCVWTVAQFEKRVTCSLNQITLDTLERGLWFLKHYSLAFHWLVMPLLVFFVVVFPHFCVF